MPNYGVTFHLGNADDLGDEAWIEEQRLPAGNRVGTNEWMLCGDWIATYGTTQGTRAFGLYVGRVQCSKPFKVFLHRSRQCVVRRVLGSPECIAATAARRTREKLERRVGRWLNLVCDLGGSVKVIYSRRVLQRTSECHKKVGVKRAL